MFYMQQSSGHDYYKSENQFDDIKLIFTMNHDWHKPNIDVYKGSSRVYHNGSNYVNRCYENLFDTITYLKDAIKEKEQKINELNKEIEDKNKTITTKEEQIKRIERITGADMI